MNIITNYVTDKKSDIRKNYQNLNNNPASKNIQFKGLLFKSKAQKIARSEFSDQIQNIAEILNFKESNIFNLIKHASKQKFHFLNCLATRYNINNFAKQEKESSEHVINLYKMVKKPNSNHFYIVNNIKGSFSDIEKIFTGINGDSKRLAFVKKFNEQIANKYGLGSQELLIDLLRSMNKNKDLRNFDKYKSYLLVNIHDKNLVKNLNEMIETKKFDPNKYNISLSTKNIFSHIDETQSFNPKIITENFSDEGHKVLNKLVNDYMISNQSLKAGNDQDLMDIYKSTTKSNVDLRLMVISKFSNNRLNNISLTEKNPDFIELRKLFENLDIDKHARNFVQKSIKKGISLYSAKEFNEVLANNNTKQLDIFFDNTKNIIDQFAFPTSHRLFTLSSEIKNPFFETQSTKACLENSSKNKSINLHISSSKFKKYIFNKINIVRDKLTKDSNVALGKPVKFETPAMPIIMPANKKSTSPRHINITRTSSSAPSAIKLQVINDVNGVIINKLGNKTLSDQKRDYAIKATKMRLSMLPEIFASIKETRAADRASGKVKFNSSNKDALNLYERINGSNKKLINYMLKKRNVDGNRMFEVNDIINTLEGAEKDMIASRKSNLKNHSRFAKEYFHNMLTDKIEQFGKA